MVGDIGYSDAEILRLFREQGYAMEDVKTCKDCPTVVVPEPVVDSSECLGTSMGGGLLVPLDDSNFRYLGDLTVPEYSPHSAAAPALLNCEMLRKWFYCAMEILNRNIDNWSSENNNHDEKYMCVFRRGRWPAVYGPMLCWKKRNKFVTSFANGRKTFRAMESGKHLIFDRYDQAQYDRAIEFTYASLERDRFGNPWHEELPSPDWY